MYSPHHLPGGSSSARSAGFPPRAGTRNAATGRRRGNPPSRRGTVGPTISFLQKETVPPGGTREKSSGPGSAQSYLKLKYAPTPHEVFREAPSSSSSGVQGPFRASCRTLGFHAPGAFSLGPLQRPVLFSLRRSRHGPSGPRRKCGVDAGSPCVGRPEYIK